MLIRRNLARHIVITIDRYASVGTAEWSKAILCEIKFIEDDWDALSWALGGITMLFARPQLQRADTTISPWPVEDLARKVRRRTVFGYTLASTLALTFLGLLWVLPSFVQRLGCCVGITAMLYTWCQLFTLRVQHRWTRASLADSAYRTELERQRDFYCRFWFWSRIAIVVSSVTLICLGGVFIHPESLYAYAFAAICLIGLLGMAVWLNLRETRQYQAQIDHLDSSQLQTTKTV
jgi:hypothetical protein